VAQALAAVGYLADRQTTTAVFLALRMNRPLLVEGPAGTGKTALALALARARGDRLIRLQCHEGVDEARALYEWDYRRQLLSIQAAAAQPTRSTHVQHSTEPARTDPAPNHPAPTDPVQSVFGEEHLLARPLLQALRAPDPVLLLIDEVDRLGIEAEALLLEVLAERQISVPELGTFTALGDFPVILTSNDSRELSQALRRRCLFLALEHPDPERERAIITRRVPELDAPTVRRVVDLTAAVRTLDLRRRPSIAESVDLATALTQLRGDTGSATVDQERLIDSLPLLLKTRHDLDVAREAFGDASS